MLKRPVVVVMIDDDPDDYSIVKSLLDRGSYNTYQPVWISDYASGLERLKAQDGDVFLLDFNLGIKSGLDMLDEAEALKLRKPIVLLTGSDNSEIDLLAMEKGASHYLQKSQLSVDHLLERTIRYAINTADMHNQMRALEALKFGKQAAESASHTKSMFLANISHEIRTPLGAILGFVDLSLAPKIGPEDRDKFLSVIRRNAQHLLILVNDLLDLSKLESGKFDVVIEPCDWRSVIQEVLQTLQPVAAAKDNHLTFIDKPSCPKWLNTDAQFLRQMLMNLVGNAIKFTRGGNIEVRVNGESSFQISVRDTGVGMNPEQKLRLFEPFVQGEAGLHRKFGGTGLGLYLSRRMAQALSGNIVLTSSTMGLGSTFTLVLPRTWAEGHQVERRVVVESEFTLKGLKVLVAEDSEDNQLLLQYLLGQAGADLTMVRTGREAVEAASKQEFDVILMDIQMPEMDGFEAAKCLREQGSQIPIVALSAHAMASESARALREGFAAYLTKPIQITQLFRTLSHYKKGETNERSSAANNESRRI